ncbi:MAG: hypothetical protein NZ602_07820 [Thermoguttaceae bacterium]|nr:hypothetical protein [Thermoguttaceae bacterium]MDW8039570.1 hypothetical protein [Thermoguttaceae bacterium]
MPEQIPPPTPGNLPWLAVTERLHSPPEPLGLGRDNLEALKIPGECGVA